MAKPKKKRDLRARLGRTITPKTGGGDAAPAPGGAVAPPNLGVSEEETVDTAAPAAESPVAAAAPAAEPRARPKPRPRASTGGGVAAPPAGIGGPAKSVGVAPPPFAAAPEPAKTEPIDPFGGGGGPVQQQVVRLEFDERIVTDAEVGKKQRFMLLLVALVVGAVALVVGGFAGSTYENNKIFDQTVADAQSIYSSVDGASDDVTRAQTLINTMLTEAAGDATQGEPPAVDYTSIESLRGIEKPIDANAMAGKNYKALPANVVHDLFAYLMNVQRLWDEFGALAATTLPEARRTELDRTAAATGEAANTLYGAVLARAPVEEGQEGPGRIIGSLAFLSIQEGEGGAPEIIARGSRGGQGRAFQQWSGTEEIGENPEFVMEINPGAVLGEQTGAFGLYLRKLAELKRLVDATVEIQGRLITAISQALSEAGVTAGAAPE